MVLYLKILTHLYTSLKKGSFNTSIYVVCFFSQIKNCLNKSDISIIYYSLVFLANKWNGL